MSNPNLKPQHDATQGAAENPPPGQIWLNGDILACSCPECSSPMSIRLWLMVADCWVCGVGIELTEEQELEARRLLEAQESATSPAKLAERPTVAKKEPAKPALKKEPAPARKPRRRVTEKRTAPAKKKPKSLVFRRRDPSVRRTGIPAALKPGRVMRRLTKVRTEGEVRLWFRDMFRNLPAWLISALVNLLILLLLAMLFIHPFEDGPRELILSTVVSPRDTPGELNIGEEPAPVEFDTTGADQPAEAIVPEPLPPVDVFNKPPLDPGELPGDIPTPQPPINPGAGGESGRGSHHLQGRSPTSRAQKALNEGGTIASEAAVARGLIWLARHQNPNGSWSLHGFADVGDCKDQCDHTGGRSDTAGTALALLPFLGAGQTHYHGQYREEVHRGLEWIIRNQKRGGDLRGPGIGNMYAHAQCAIVLCEAYALTRDEWLREPAQRAIDFIVKAQHSRGGWRYTPGSPGDTSVVGWQLMALRSAEMAYLDVPEGVFERANSFLNDVQFDQYGGAYGYTPGSRATPAMTAEALLCRQYYGWPRDHAGLRIGCKWLLESHLPRKQAFNVYYVYYATQVMHHMQGDYFREWNNTVRDMLVDMQETRGHQAGSWTPVANAHSRDRSGGRLYWTSMAICSLEVYYRHLPLYGGGAVGEQ
ncbi:MAG: hypothetical protein MPJ50_07105 [Pirellulales bacterium]|nr:hypothetical protein [Pirellulales bacterium]